MVARPAPRPTALPPRQPFPSSRDAAVQAARLSVKAALAAGYDVLEVDIPPSLYGVAGDGDGAGETLAAATMLRSLLRAFESVADRVRVYFPDAAEAAVQTGGAGSTGVPATFAGARFRVDHLNTPSPLNDFGITLKRRDMGATVAADDALLVRVRGEGVPRRRPRSARAGARPRARPGSGPVY